MKRYLLRYMKRTTDTVNISINYISYNAEILNISNAESTYRLIQQKTD